MASVGFCPGVTYKLIFITKKPFAQLLPDEGCDCSGSRRVTARRLKLQLQLLLRLIGVRIAEDVAAVLLLGRYFFDSVCTV